MALTWKEHLKESVKDFHKELNEFTERLIPDEIHKLQTALAVEALKRIVLRTPVDEGRARGNWNVTIDDPYDGVSEILDDKGQRAVSYGSHTIRSAAPFSVIFITNNIDYINILEEGLFVPPNPGPSKDPRRGRFGQILVSGGHSTQAPQGMVLVTVEELRMIFP